MNHQYRELQPLYSGNVRHRCLLSGNGENADPGRKLNCNQTEKIKRLPPVGIPMSVLRITFAIALLTFSGEMGQAALIHQYTFNNGTADDAVGLVNGTVSGVTISDGKCHFDGIDDSVSFGRLLPQSPGSMPPETPRAMSLPLAWTASRRNGCIFVQRTPRLRALACERTQPKGRD
jgi:hypothetical protein